MRVGVPARQAGEQFIGDYPGLRSRTRSSLGYNLVGFQPSELALRSFRPHRPVPCLMCAKGVSSLGGRNAAFLLKRV